MRILTTVYSRFEAEILVQKLQAEGIRAVVNGALEYASIITGTGQGKFKIEVEDAAFDRAQSILKQSTLTPVSEPEESTENVVEELSPTSNLRRAITFAFLGCFLVPIVFNLVSIKPFWRYFRAEGSTKRYAWLLVYLAVNSMAAVVVYILLG